jgi:hypothetical protein
LWIETTSHTFTLRAETTTDPLIKVSLTDGFWTVCFDSRQIDAPPPLKGSPPPPAAPPGAPVDQYKTLCTIQQAVASGLAFLHLPLEKGRASLFRAN